VLARVRKRSQSLEVAEGISASIALSREKSGESALRGGGKKEALSSLLRRKKNEGYRGKRMVQICCMNLDQASKKDGGRAAL